MKGWREGDREGERVFNGAPRAVKHPKLPEPPHKKAYMEVS